MEAQVIVTVGADEQRVAVYHNPDTGRYFWVLYQVHSPSKIVAQTEYPDFSTATDAGFRLALKMVLPEPEPDEGEPDQSWEEAAAEEPEPPKKRTPAKNLGSGDAGYWTPERRQEQSERMKARYNDPEARRKISEGMQRSYERRNRGAESRA